MGKATPSLHLTQSVELPTNMSTLNLLAAIQASNQHCKLTPRNRLLWVLPYYVP